MKRSELFFTFLLVPIDLFMVLLAFVLAYKFRLYFEIVPASYFQPLFEYIKFIIMFLPIWLVVFAVSGLYGLRERMGLLKEVGKIIVSSSAALALFMVLIFFSRTFFFSRLIVIFSWLLVILLVILGRFLIRFMQRFLYRYDIGVHRVIILGKNSFTKPIVEEIRRRRSLGYRIVKIIDQDGIDKLAQILAHNPCDEILVTDPAVSEKQVGRILEFCRLNQLGFKMTPSLLLVRSSHINMETLAGAPILEFKRTPLDGWGKIIKRIFDIFVSFILIILLSPIMLIVALMVKLTSKGPVFFCQERVGLDSNFTFYKFRTMKENAQLEHEKLMKKYGKMFKLKEDPRLTSIGGFLRRTSLDELPQFFNALKGNMSLIGPRPPMPEEVARYNNWEKSRLGVKPGITGLWQVSGRSELSFDEWVKLDSYYIENWSLWLDLQIFLRTLVVVFKGRGAY